MSDKRNCQLWGEGGGAGAARHDIPRAYCAWWSQAGMLLARSEAVGVQGPVALAVGMPEPS